MKNVLLFSLSIAFLSCNHNTSSISSNEESKKKDSLELIKKEMALSLKLNAKNFDSFYVQYSIDFDSLKNQKFYLTDFYIKDIIKQSDKFYIKLSSTISEDIFLLNLTEEDVKKLKYEDNEKYIIVFSVLKANKIDGIIHANTEDSEKNNGDESASESPTVSIKIENNNDAFQSYFFISGNLISITNK